MSLKKIAILGSTGSIGISTLKIVERFPKKFSVVALSAHNNVALLESQIRKFNPKYVALQKEKILDLKKRIYSRGVKIFDVASEIALLVNRPDVDIVILGIQGRAALEPFLEAARCGKIIAPANKEALVMAGDIIMSEARKHKATVIPVDSEQSAIFQCLEGRDKRDLNRVYLTASGGSLKDVNRLEFDQISVKQILAHPRWSMGKKITVDSATLMNKGLEIIEAMRLFNLPAEKIQVLIHPESIIHSMVEFCDGAIIAQLGVTDMRIPIQYALTYPKRVETGLSSLDFIKQKKLTFQKPDFKKFPSLKLCYEVAQKSGSLPSVLNAANEEAVDAFLKQEIKFSQIYKVVQKVVRYHKMIKNPNLKMILESDRWAREQARKEIDR
ncbi:MAG: 1-deoxy-D-xylulose-5-phosphate reductoisomerase [Candidatus Omnitrophica bacterium]|nr:1-deoxy-D-xylulose-5-phosphate reductoisomerase [Candidatus Omnitrophota bacterium]